MSRWLALLLCLTLAHPSVAGESVAFFYGERPPAHLLAHFHHLVVEPENVDSDLLGELQAEGRIVHAYVSVGELGKERPWADETDPAWQLGENPDWNSRVMDLSAQGWRDFLFERRFRPLWQRGYRGFFLDTLDSHLLVAEDDGQRKRQQAGLVMLIHRLRREFPEASIFVNRGFEVIDQVGQQIDGLAVESLYRGWDPAGESYTEVDPAQRQWLQERLRTVRERFPHLTLMVLDYLPAGARDQARETAQRIRRDGYVPWVSTVGQDQVGIGTVEVLPREILMLYDSGQEPDGELAYADIHRLAAMPVEYLGYVPVYHDLRKGLPEGPLKGRYAGVISWLSAAAPQPGYGEWVYARIEEGVPVLMLGDPGFEFDEGFLARLGLRRSTVPGTPPWKVAGKDGLIGFEADVPRMTGTEVAGFLALEEDRDPGDNRFHLVVADESGRKQGVVITGPWGGLALSPWLVDPGLGERARWIVDPFALIRTALRLEDLPMPEVTTLNGRRLWMNHIDGDAFVSRAELPGTPLAAEVIRDRILERYPYPHTVSVIEGEIGPDGLYPEQSEKLEAVARSIFRLPNVEAASHSYSHPFKWAKVAGKSGTEEGYTLPIPGYTYDPAREILGSVEYVNRLLPGGKKCRIFQWTGDTLSGVDELRLIHEHGYLNVNGGDTTITRTKPFLVFVSPMARPVGPYLQVYAPVMNENVYTNDWTGPFYGFRRVIETFQLTDRPRRLKPIDIYYHFYSGTKPAALKALNQVYRWAEAQETTPVYLSDYLPLVEEFRRITIARRPDGRLQYRGIERLRELRLFRGGIDLRRSRQVAGMRLLHDGLYIHLSGHHPLLQLRPGEAPAPTVPHLHQANGQVELWKRGEKGEIRLRLRARVPALLELAGVRKECLLRLADGRRLRAAADDDHRARFTFRQRKTIDGTIECR